MARRQRRPNPWFFARLISERPRDINIQAAVSDVAGVAPFYFVGDNTGLSTLNSDMARWHERQGAAVRCEEIPITTLQEIAAEHVGNGAVHFLKVDVEGHELEALRGNDYSRWRPWIIVGEAHDQEQTWTAWKAWQALLESVDYRFVYQDGLNRFFVAAERYAALAAAFCAPPNCYDDWQRAEDAHLVQRVATAESRAAELALMVDVVQHTRDKGEEQYRLQAMERAASLETELAQTKAEVASLRMEIASLRASISWRLTRPLRAVRSLHDRE